MSCHYDETIRVEKKVNANYQAESVIKNNLDQWLGGYKKFFNFMWDGVFDEIEHALEYDWFEYDRAPRPALVAFDAMTDILNKAKPIKEIVLGTNYFSGLFKKGNTPIGVLSKYEGALEKNLIELPQEKVEVLDIMGNVIPSAEKKGNKITIPVSTSTIYIVGKGISAEEMEKAIKGVEFDTVFAKAEFIRLSEKDNKPALVVGVKNSGLISGINGKVRVTKKPSDWIMEEEGEITDLAIDESAIVYLPVSKLGNGEISDFTIEISDKSGKKIESQGTVKIVRAIKIAKDSIKIDGIKSEWENIPSIQLNKASALVNWRISGDINDVWKDDNDLSAVIKVCYDEENIYMLVDVKDDNVFMDKEVASQLSDRMDNIYKADCVEIFFDTQLKRDFLESEYNGDDIQLVVAPISENNPEVRIAKGGESGGADISTIEAKSEKTKDGYILEIKMPVKSTFPQLKLKQGLLIGYNIAIDDDDVAGYAPDMNGQTRLGRELQIGWRAGHKPITKWGILVLE
jgi:hypothetical protein